MCVNFSSVPEKLSEYFLDKFMSLDRQTDGWTDGQIEYLLSQEQDLYKFQGPWSNGFGVRAQKRKNYQIQRVIILQHIGS